MSAGVDTAAWRRLRLLIVAAGISASLLFIIVGLATELQMFGDGSIFSYAVAAQEAWAFHWHNISGRLFSYVYAYVPAETVVALTGSAKAGIAVYGLLHFSAQALGLLATFAADRSTGRMIFVYACLSTACLCPLVYGAPTEMWMAHAVFWPALALCLYAPAGGRSAAAVSVALLALVFTHEGAIVLAGAILFAIFLRGWREPVFIRAATAFAIAMLIWIIVKLAIRPDDYIAPVMAAAAYKFIDVENLTDPVFVLLMAALAIYDIAVLLFRRIAPHRAHACAVIACTLLLAVYWFWFDHSLLAEARYNLRTVLLIVTPAFGIAAAVHAMDDEARRNSPLPFLAKLAEPIENSVNPKLIAGALLLILLVHMVETTKFVWSWTNYKTAIRALATGTQSDPSLGNPSFVSSQRIDPSLNRLAWNSTTPFLSVLVAPGLAATRLVVDPSAGYFWLSCETAKQSEQVSSAVPLGSRRLIREHACLHR
jgi:hypothetical protein